MAGAAAAALGRCASAQPCDPTGRRARLDKRGAARLGRAMAAPMIPPPYATDFLAALGWPGCEIRPLAGDASFRRYFRIHHGARRAVLMDAPPPHEDPRPFIAVAEW